MPPLIVATGTAGETACPTLLDQSFGEVGGAGGFACRWKLISIAIQSRKRLCTQRVVSERGGEMNALQTEMRLHRLVSRSGHSAAVNNVFRAGDGSGADIKTLASSAVEKCAVIYAPARLFVPGINPDGPAIQTINHRFGMLWDGDITHRKIPRRLN